MPNSTVQAAAEGLPKDPIPSAFRLVGDMENPLTTINDLLAALAMIAETLDDEDACVVQRLAWIAKDHRSAIEGMRGELFRLLHPNRAHFEQVAWPGQVGEAAACAR